MPETPRPAWPRHCLWGHPEKGSLSWSRFPKLNKLRLTAASPKLTKIPKPDVSPHLSSAFPLLPVDDDFIKLKTALALWKKGAKSLHSCWLLDRLRSKLIKAPSQGNGLGSQWMLRQKPSGCSAQAEP